MSDETVLVHHPKVCAGPVIVQPFVHHAANDGFAHAQACASCPHAHDALVHDGFEGLVAASEGGQETRKRNGTSALNVVIEHQVLVAVFGQKLPCVRVGKVFELYEDIGPAVAKGRHHFVNKLKELGVCGAGLLQAKVERVVNQLLTVGTEIENNRKNPLRVNAGACNVKV